VLRILENSPASKADFKIGDVVIEFDGKRIQRSSDLPIAVGNTEVGKRVKVKVIREGKTLALSVKIGELPSEEELAQTDTPKKPAKLNKLGIVVGGLTAEQRRRFEIKQGGVIVQEVEKGAASEANIRRGDVILKMNNRDVKDVEHFEKLVKELSAGQSIPVLIQRGSNPIFLAIKIPKD
jgi:serine protease Do